MKFAIRYQSRGGNTKEVAEAIAKVAGTTAESIEKPIVEPVDLLIIGGGVYKWDIDPSLKNYLETLTPELVKSVAAFTTAGGMDKTKTILSIVKSKGINAQNETLSVKAGIRNFGGKGHLKLTEKQIQSINNFVNKLIH
ncbi:MAG: flavodoxin domain-containing protein [Spirochaetaceae bacterium]|jgi:flavodoxin|nr:flavodoxin domain-containing protein [Spirochaetaceae bacterium]